MWARLVQKAAPKALPAWSINDRQLPRVLERFMSSTLITNVEDVSADTIGARQRTLQVCQVIECTGAGGSARHLIDLVDTLVGTHGVETHLIWSPLTADAHFTKWIEASKIAHHPIAMHHRPGLHDVKAVRAIRKYLTTHGPFDVVHGHSSKGGALARLAAVGLGAKVVYTPHALVVMNPSLPRIGRFVYGSVEKLLMPLTHRMIAVSSEERDVACKLGMSQAKVAVVPNGIEAGRHADRQSIRRQLDLAADEVVVGYVGRMVPQKNPELLLNAFAGVVPGNPKAVLVLVGDGPLMSQVRSRIDELGIADRVRLLGARPGRALMPAFDVFVLPSRYEGFPYVALEAMDAGLPLIATDKSNCQILIGDDEAGIVTPSGCVASLRKALADLIEDSVRRRRAGAAARDRVAKFDLQRMAKETLRVYAN
jgi:glycosyltransferase involved in cell wall biosynthesis